MSAIQDRLFVAIARWCLANGWTRPPHADVTAPDGLTTVEWEADTGTGDRWLTVRRRPRPESTRTVTVADVEVTSVQQAADVLAALGLLPAEFSSAYRTGRADAFADTAGAR